MIGKTGTEKNSTDLTFRFVGEKGLLLKAFRSFTEKRRSSISSRGLQESLYGRRDGCETCQLQKM